MPAAQYVRMSTDHQQYSPAAQKETIAGYALAHDMKIVRTRWGRFQDADEAAYHEHECRRAGVRVIYCTEPFENDGSPFAGVYKSIKRAMAGKYSRELSGKVFLGQCRLVQLGFWQGASLGYGLRRLLVDAAGNAKGQLAPLEHKSIQTDRVVLVPGPANEVSLVRRIFDWYVNDRISSTRIADRLNAIGLYNSFGRPWNKPTIRRILMAESTLVTTCTTAVLSSCTRPVLAIRRPDGYGVRVPLRPSWTRRPSKQHSGV